MAIDYSSPVWLVRVLVNDVDEGAPDGFVFTDDEITAYLALERGNVKRAAAQAIDTIADNEALASKVLKDHQLSTDGAKVADSLRKRAAALRAQADRDDDESDDGVFFEFIPMNSPTCGPEHTGHQHPWWH